MKLLNIVLGLSFQFFGCNNPEIVKDSSEKKNQICEINSQFERTYTVIDIEILHSPFNEGELEAIKKQITSDLIGTKFKFSNGFNLFIDSGKKGYTPSVDGVLNPRGNYILKQDTIHFKHYVEGLGEIQKKYKVETVSCKEMILHQPDKNYQIKYILESK